MALKFLDLTWTLSFIGEHSAFWKSGFFLPIILDVIISAFRGSKWTIQKSKPVFIRHTDHWTR